MRHQIKAPLSKKLKVAGAAGATALTLAVVMGTWFEGTGPTKKMADGTLMYRSYRDTGNIWTACHGVTKGVQPNTWYTQAQCDVMETEAYSVAEADAKRLFTYYNNYNRWTQATLIDMTYNLGSSKLEKSTMRRKFNAGDKAGGCQEMAKWVKGRVNGQLVPLPGLVDRRKTSEDICLYWKD